MTLPRRRVASAIVIAGALVLPACSTSGGWSAPKVVRIDSKEPVAALMPSWLTWLSDSPEGQPQALLLRDGDFVFGSDAPFRYLASDGPSVKIEAEKSLARIGQKTVTLSLDSPDTRTWLSRATEPQLKDLRTVAVPKDIDADLLESLRRLASTNPSVDLMFESEDGVLRTLPIFKPRAIFLPDEIKAATLASLANQPQLETVLVKCDEPGGLDVLAKLPKLRHLVLGDWNPAKAGPLPAGLNSLRGLVLAGADELKDLSGLKNLPDTLEELSVLHAPHLTDITPLSRFAHLNTLVLNGDEGIGDLSGLSSMESLRWVGVPPKTTQEQFASFVGAHPNLAILDLVGNPGISSLAPLSSLKSLEGLILQGPYENMSAVHGLKTLKFLGVSAKTWDASPDQIAALKTALPDALVVRVSPFCLGSGWILLLLPALGVTTWLARRRASRQLAA